MKTSQVIAMIISVVVVIPGCGVTSKNYETSREMLKGSPSLRSDFINTCVAGTSSKPLAQRQAMAKVMNVSVSSAPRVYCQRITRGVTSGRLTHADINAGGRGQLSPALVRVLQGR